MTAEESVQFVVKELKTLGFTIPKEKKNPNANGPDIVAVKDDICTFEVKRARRSTRCWKVSKTQRFNDDYVAIVMPSGRVHFEEMSSHKEKCSKDGTRRVTKLVKLYETADVVLEPRTEEGVE